MSFNPDVNKQAQEVIFSTKLYKRSHSKVFNNAPVICANWQKAFIKVLDESLNFSYHIKAKMSKAMKGIGITIIRVNCTKCVHVPSARCQK